MLIAKYNKFDQCVEIGDLNNPSDGWVDYDPTQGASSDELTEICNSLYDRCLLAELGIEGFTPANMQYLVKQPLMFNDKLQPIYDGKVLVNQSAMDNPVVQTVLKEMSLRNFEPQRINNYGVWYISDRH